MNLVYEGVTYQADGSCAAEIHPGSQSSIITTYQFGGGGTKVVILCAQYTEVGTFPISRSCFGNLESTFAPPGHSYVPCGPYTDSMITFTSVAADRIAGSYTAHMCDRNDATLTADISGSFDMAQTQ